MAFTEMIIKRIYDEQTDLRWSYGWMALPAEPYGTLEEKNGHVVALVHTAETTFVPAR